MALGQRHVLVMTAALCSAPALGAAAQASPYVPLDDPAFPFIEHLIARGDLADPSPFVRPFRRDDLRRVLVQADSAGTGDSLLIDRLLDRFTEADSAPRWRIEPRIGGQAYSHSRRDPLHAEGPDGAQFYGELGLEAVVGNLALVTRPVVEPRLIDDPDWPGRRDIEVAGRMADAYISAQFRWARLLYGQLDRNWGPSGLAGIPLSNYGYGRPELGFEVGTGRVRFQTLASDLRDERDSSGALVHRYFFAHRLGARLSRRMYLALWETVAIGGVDRNFDDRLRNPLSLSFLENAYGLGIETNSMLGMDLEWKAGRRLTLQTQLALDDLTYKDRDAPDRNPDRWALTVMAFGPLGRQLSWRALYSAASSLAFRTFDNQFQDFTDGGTGIGRNFADNDQLTLRVAVPVASRWLLTPELTLLRQGEGDLDDPYPTGIALGDTPQIFIGTVEKTLRAALRIDGSLAHFRLSADAGYHRIMNHNHIDGRTVSRFEGRLMLTAGLAKRGTLP
jgi:hypothetical protein